MAETILQQHLDQEALDWFNQQVYGFDCYDPERWGGHPRSHEPERGLHYGRLLRLERAFEMAWKFKPDPSGKIPPARAPVHRRGIVANRVCPICKKRQCSGAFGYPCDGLLDAAQREARP